jgi:hypothetical protein
VDRSIRSPQKQKGRGKPDLSNPVSKVPVHPWSPEDREKHFDASAFRLPSMAAMAVIISRTG